MSRREKNNDKVRQFINYLLNTIKHLEKNNTIKQEFYVCGNFS